MHKAWSTWSEKPGNPLSKAAAVATETQQETFRDVSQDNQDFSPQKVLHLSYSIVIRTSEGEAYITRKAAEIKTSAGVK